MKITLILYNIRSGNNIGSIFRTCDALGVEQVLLCGISATPPHKEILKTALGATQSVKWHYFDDVLQCMNQLKTENYRLVSIEQTTNSLKLNEFLPDTNENYALIFGNEVEGISLEVIAKSDFSLEIPQFGVKKSLNVAVAAGIVLWDFVSKTKFKT